MASVRRRPDGKWRARYRDSSGKEHARHFARKIDAEKWVTDQASKVNANTWIDPKHGVQTVGDFFDEWSGRQIWTRGTLSSYKTTFAGITFADTAIGQVRRSDVEAWVKKMQSDGLAASTIKTRFTHVSSLLKSAHRDRLIAFNPAEGVALPRERRKAQSMTVPTTEQVGKVLGTVIPQTRPLIALCAFAGLRIGEASAIKLEDIDFMRRVVKVRRQRRPSGEIALPKFGSERDVAAPDTLLEILARHIESQGVPTEGWLFPSRKTGPLSADRVRSTWDDALEACQLDFRVHDLRHFYASGLIAAGCDVVTVQRALGHASASVTLNTYSHLWPDAEDRTRAAAEQLARSSCGLDADLAAV